MEIYNDKLNPEIIRKRFPLFEPELCQEVSDHGTWAFVEKGEPLMQGDNYIKTFPLVLDGILRISRNDDSGKETRLYYLNAGEVCAMALTCCMSYSKSNIYAVAEEDADVMLLPVNLLDEWLSKYQGWKQFMMFAYKDRFDELLETVDSLAFKKMDERLVTFFIDYHKTTKKTEYRGTHEEIARALTSSREVISRLLKALEKEGKIELGRNRVNFKGLVEKKLPTK